MRSPSPLRSRSAKTLSVVTAAWAAATWYGSSAGGIKGSRPGIPERDSSLVRACSTGPVACQARWSVSRPKSLIDRITRFGYRDRMSRTDSIASAEDPGRVFSMKMSVPASSSVNRTSPVEVEGSTSILAIPCRLIAVATGTESTCGPTGSSAVTPRNRTTVTSAPRSASRRPTAVIGPEHESRTRTPARGGS